MGNEQQKSQQPFDYTKVDPALLGHIVESSIREVSPGIYRMEIRTRDGKLPSAIAPGEIPQRGDVWRGMLVTQTAFTFEGATIIVVKGQSATESHWDLENAQLLGYDFDSRANNTPTKHFIMDWKGDGAVNYNVLPKAGEMFRGAKITTCIRHSFEYVSNNAQADIWAEMDEREFAEHKEAEWRNLILTMSINNVLKIVLPENIASLIKKYLPGLQKLIDEHNDKAGQILNSALCQAKKEKCDSETYWKSILGDDMCHKGDFFSDAFCIVRGAHNLVVGETVETVGDSADQLLSKFFKSSWLPVIGIGAAVLLLSGGGRTVVQLQK